MDENSPTKGPPRGDRVSQVLASDVVKKLRKANGESTLLRASDMMVRDVPRIPTGIFDLDYALGGGFPVGKITTLYGPKSSGKTTTYLKTIANAQNMCSNCYSLWVPEEDSCKCGDWRDTVCAFLDVEGALDVPWARKLGVDTNNLILDIPEYAEQALDMGEALLRSGDVDVLVLDSLAFLVPRKEIENSIAKESMGVQPKLIGSGIRKFVAAMNGVGRDTGRRPTVLFTNQIRFKLGLLFGTPECLNWATVIPFADGTHHTIKDVVEKKLIGPVWGYSDTKGFYPTRVSKHLNNGKALDGGFLTVISESVDTKGGTLSATVSPTHNFLTDSGWKQAADLTLSDKLVTKYTNVINGSLKDFMSGALCGDTTVVRKKLRAFLRFQDKNNPDYTAWKANKLAPFWEFRSNLNKKGSIVRESSPSHDILNFSEPQKGRDPLPMLRNFSWMAMAVWFMDDACLHRDRYTLGIKRYKSDKAMQNSISETLATIGLGAHSWTTEGVVFRTHLTDFIAENIAKYIPPCMRYKLPDPIRESHCYEEFELSSTPKFLPAQVNIKSVLPAATSKYKNRNYYDISVPDGQNYLAGNKDSGFVVHNTTSGGQAPGFAAAVEVRVQSQKYELSKETKKPLWVDMKFRVVKNKTYGAKMEGEYRMMLSATNNKEVGDTCDEASMVKWGEQVGLITRDKGYNCLGQTFRIKQDLIDALEADPAYSEDLRAHLMPILIQL